MLVVQVVTIVNVVEGDWGVREDVKVVWMSFAQGFGCCKGVDKDGRASIYAVSQTMEDLVSRRMLEVPVLMIIITP